MKIDELLEEWRPVVSFEFAYEVSSLGRIKSLSREVSCVGGRWGGRTIKLKEKILSEHRTTRGYRGVGLTKDGVTRVAQLHRLVAVAFLGVAPSDEHEVHHKDGDPGNNHADNLAWVTRRENLYAKDGVEPVRLTCPCCSTTLALQYRGERRPTGLEVVA